MKPAKDNLSSTAKFSILFPISLLTIIALLPMDALAEPGKNQDNINSATTFPNEPLLTDVIIGDSSCRIEWDKTPNIAGHNLYLKLEDETYKPLNSAIIKDSFVRITGLKNGTPYRFAITAINREGEESNASETGLVIPVGFSHKVLPIPGGSSASDYRLFTNPFRAEKNSPKNIFSYFPVYDIKAWRLFSRERDGYKEFNDIPEIAPGRGYWLLTRKNSDIFLSGKTVNPYEPFTVQLHPGWNIIGSPYLFPVEWNEVVLHNKPNAGRTESAAWEFVDGGFRKAASLQPFKGYYFYNGESEDVDFLIPPVPYSPISTIEVKNSNTSGINGISMFGENSWALSLSAADGTYSDHDNVLGVIPNAETNGRAIYTVEPPSWPQHLSLFFTEKGEEDNRLASDIRNSDGEWYAVVSGGENKKVTISWETLKSGPIPLLIDTVSDKEVEMTGTGSYTFARKDLSPRKFIIRSKNSVQ